MASSSSSTSKLLQKPVKLALIQLATGLDKATNLSLARRKVLEAARAGASIVVLPECFNSPYGTQHFPHHAEKLVPSPPSISDSPTFHALAQMARDSSTFLVGGSIPEYEPLSSSSSLSSTATPTLFKDGDDGGGGGGGDDHDKNPKQQQQQQGRYYNTSLTFSPTGTHLGTHRKLHLFDINITGPGGITFQESSVLTAGNQITLLRLEGYGTIGVGICYDIRFPEPAMIAARRGAFAVIYPGAFNLTTGPVHWSLLARARALDNQIYVASCSPARNLSSGSYHAWGHSLVVDPYAQVLVEAGHQDEIVYADLCPDRIEQVRNAIPLQTQRRFDVYRDVSCL